MMNKKKLLSTICAAALTVSVAGASIASAIAADKGADILKGKATDIDGTTVTLQMGAPMGAPEQKDDGAGQLPPAKPEGEMSDDLTPPAKPEGEQDDTKQPPEAGTVELDVSDAAITEGGEDALALLLDEPLPHSILNVADQLKGHALHLVHIVAEEDAVHLLAIQLAVLHGLLVGVKVAQRAHAIAVADILGSFDILHGDADLTHARKAFCAHSSPPH